MENCYYHSGLLEVEKNCADFSAAPSNESSLIVPWSMEPHILGYKCSGYPSTIEGLAENKATTVSSSHSRAEKRRCDRINTHLSALWQLIPDSKNMDKAALLGSAIEQVKDLKRKTKEISKDFDISTASICCDDRPKVLSELIRVHKGLRLSTIKADISSVGGRMKTNFILCSDDGVSLNALEHSLNVVLRRNASSSLDRIVVSEAKGQGCFRLLSLHSKLGLIVPKVSHDCDPDVKLVLNEMLPSV